MKYATTYEIAVRGVNSDGNGAWAQYPDIITGAADAPVDAIPSTPIPPTPDANTVRLVSRVGYTLDVEELNLLEVRGPEGALGNVRKVSFVCTFTDSGEVEVSDTPVAYSETSDVVMHKMPVERKSTAASTLLAVSSRTIQDATCSARLYATSASTNFNETNSVSLRFQKKGTTWFRKEEAFDNTPGGSEHLAIPAAVGDRRTRCGRHSKRRRHPAGRRRRTWRCGVVHRSAAGALGAGGSGRNRRRFTHGSTWLSWEVRICSTNE